MATVTLDAAFAYGTRYAARLLRRSYRSGPEPTVDARSPEDFCQEALLGILRRSGSFDADEKLPTHLLIPAIRNCVTSARRRMAQTQVADLDAGFASPDPEHELGESGLLRGLRVWFREDKVAARILDEVEIGGDSRPRFLAEEMQVDVKMIYEGKRRIRRRLRELCDRRRGDTPRAVG
ncbi:MAG: hypothetical protein AAF682_00510 [Planctomycetota bacterium]